MDKKVKQKEVKQDFEKFGNNELAFKNTELRRVEKEMTRWWQKFLKDCDAKENQQ